jgi:hypothetical protein
MIRMKVLLTELFFVFRYSTRFIAEIRSVVSVSDLSLSESRPWRLVANVGREWKLPQQLWLLPTSMDGLGLSRA